jgi:hypothetical protein
VGVEIKRAPIETLGVLDGALAMDLDSLRED